MPNSYDGRVVANALHIPLADESVHVCVTSPPYWHLRSYQIPPTIWNGDIGCSHTWTEREEWHDVRECTKCDGALCQLGLEPTISMYIEHLVSVFDEVWRVLRKDGTCYVNIGDSFANAGGRGVQGAGGQRQGRANTKVQAKLHSQRPTDGLKPKDMCGIPWRFALAMRERGWYWRSTIVWAKPSPTPGSQKDRPTSSWEPLFLFAKNQHYFYDYVAVMEPCTGNAHSRGDGTGPKTADGGSGVRNNKSFSTAVRDVVLARNRRDVWTINSEPLSEPHYAAYPQKLVEPCILAGTSACGVCANCGGPYRRIVEKQLHGDMTPAGNDMRNEGVRRTSKESKAKWRAAAKQASGRRMIDNVQAARDAGGDHDHPFLPPRTIGWAKTCRCSTEMIKPAVVFDPFLGSGTTARVAERLNRRWVGLDLGYQEMQGRRLQNVQKRLTGLSV